MTTPPTSAGPDWVRETIAVTRSEIRHFAATVNGFCRHPSRFSAAWMAGQTRALNPLGFLATALAISGTVGSLVPGNDEGGILGNLAAATLPYAYYVLLGVLCHPLLRLAGSTRPLRATVAISLFAGGGPGLLVALGGDLMVCLRVALFGAYKGSVAAGVPPWAQPPLLLLLFVPMLFLLASLALGLGGLHGLRRGRAAVALLIALLLSAVLLGVLHGRFAFALGTPHLVFTMRRGWPMFDIYS